MLSVLSQFKKTEEDIPYGEKAEFIESNSSEILEKSESKDKQEKENQKNEAKKEKPKSKQELNEEEKIQAKIQKNILF